jgi:hypothetical protein
VGSTHKANKKTTAVWYLQLAIVAEEVVHLILDARRQVPQQVRIGHHAAVVDKALAGKVPVGLHDLRHVRGAGGGRHRVRGLVPVADAAEGLLLDGLVLSGVALLEDLFHRSLFTNKTLGDTIKR